MPVCVSRCLFVIPHIPSFHPNGVRLVETQNLASPVLSITINVCNDSVMINAFFLVRRKILRLYFCVDTLSPCFPAAVLLCVRRNDVAGRMFMPASTAITAIPVSPFSICHNVFDVMRVRCFVLF